MRAVLCCLSWMLLAQGCSAAPWKPYRSTSGRFRVLLPGTPAEKTETHRSSLGNITLTTYILETPAYRFTIVTTDFPEAEVTPATVAQMVDQTIKQLAVAHHAASQRDVTVGGVHAKELTVALSTSVVPGGGTLKGRFFVVKHRMYQVLVVVRRGKGTLQDAYRYLNSFKALP